jgi:hypothetical protein
MGFPNATDIVATTIQQRSGVIADNVTKNNALLTWLKSRGNRKTFSGGNEIIEELSFAENGNGSFYSGYDVLPTGASDVISASTWQIKQAAVPITISGLEELQNAGKERIIDLLEGRINVAESTLSNMIATSLYSDGTGSGGKEIGGLALTVPTDPSTGIAGGINRATWNFWRSKIFNATSTGGAAATADNIVKYMNTLYAQLVRGSDHPDLILMDNQYWSLFMESLQDKQRFTSAESAKNGFATIKYMNADIVLDGGMGGSMASKTMFMLNTKYLFFRTHSKRNFVSLSPEKRYSTNQDAQVIILAWAGNMTANGLQFQGKMVDA